MTKLTPIQPGNRIQLPSDWAAEVGLNKYAALEKTRDGILVHPFSGHTWDDVFAHKLRVRSAPDFPNAVEVSGDSVLL